MSTKGDLKMKKGLRLNCSATTASSASLLWHDDTLLS